MVAVAQLVRGLDCGSRGRGFETHLPPNNKCPDGGTGRHAAFKPQCPYGVRVQLPLGVQRRDK